jgi:tetratricopeptide (TPR) repeat protein
MTAELIRTTDTTLHHRQKGWLRLRDVVVNRCEPVKTMNTKISMRLGVLSVVLPLFSAYPLPAQMTPVQQLTQAMVLEKEGKAASAIAAIQPLLDSQVLDALSRGKAWHIEGLAYESQGDVPSSQRAYEESLRILESLPNSVQDYALALDDFGGLYQSTGQFGIAEQMTTKALGLYERVDDRAGIVRASYDLATIAFSRKNVPEGSGYLKDAVKEARTANGLDDDDRAAIASLQGWQAQFYGNYTVSVVRYRQALDLWRGLHGEEHPYTGWGYLLLGEADAAAGQLTSALAEMKQSIAILDRSVGRRNPRYLEAEMAYARVLDRTGSESAAAQIRSETESVLKNIDHSQCVGCILSAGALH